MLNKSRARKEGGRVTKQKEREREREILQEKREVRDRQIDISREIENKMSTEKRQSGRERER